MKKGYLAIVSVTVLSFNSGIEFLSKSDCESVAVAANGCPCIGIGSWTEYPECIIETEPFTVCEGVVPTDAEILEHVDLRQSQRKCTGGNSYYDCDEIAAGKMAH